jgi:hypothetical protein
VRHVLLRLRFEIGRGCMNNFEIEKFCALYISNVDDKS